MDTTTTISEEIAAAIADGIAIRARKQAEDDAWAENNRLVAQEENRDAWAPIRAEIERRIPDWAHQFITEELNYEPEFWLGETRVKRPVVIKVPGCTPIHAYAAYHQQWLVQFVATEYALDSELEIVARAGDYGRTYWQLNGCNEGEQEFLLALAQAAENERQRQAVEERAASYRLSAENRAAAIARLERDWFREAAELYMTAPESSADACMITAGLLAIAQQLRSRYASD